MRVILMSLPMLLATLIVITPNSYESSARVGVNPRNDPASMPTPSPRQGGFSGAGKQFSVEVLRQYQNGSRVPMRIDVKKYLEGKVESDFPLQAGDQMVAQGNTKKTLGTIGAIADPGSLITAIARDW